MKPEDQPTRTGLESFLAEDMDMFVGWSTRQKQVFGADVLHNEATGAIGGLQVGDRCIKAVVSLLGRVDYHPVQVIRTTDVTVTTDLKGNEFANGTFSRTDGVNVLGAEFGWLTLEFKVPPQLDAPADTTPLL